MNITNDFQISIGKRRKFKFVPPERVWPQIRDHYDDTPNVFDGLQEKSRNRVLWATVQTMSSNGVTAVGIQRWSNLNKHLRMTAGVESTTLFVTCAEYNSEMLTYKPLTNNAV
jgi:hypothetical protein